MDRTFKCPNGHRFKSGQEAPLCPQCSEKASPIQWNKIEPNEKETAKPRKQGIRKMTGTVLDVATAGLFSEMTGPAKPENPASKDYKGGGGDFGGGGASGAF